MAAIDEDPSAPKLPRQVSRITFQSAESLFKDLVDSNFYAEDFMEVVIEYAEHDGAAIDLYKLARLGRLGENGSEEVAKGYSRRCIEETPSCERVIGYYSSAPKQIILVRVDPDLYPSLIALY